MQKHKAIMSEKQTTEGNNDRMHKSWGTLVGLGLSYT
jgi:hypothetical protein